jgi:integrase
MLTGARLAEVFEARWSEIGAGALRLPAERSKSKEGRVIWLSAPAQEIIDTLPSFVGGDWLLTVSGRLPFKAYGTSKVRLDAALVAAGEKLPPWRVHDIRRSVATGLQRLGVRLEIIETVLGHISGSRSGIVATYQRHRFEVEAAEAVRRWGEHIAGLLDPQPATVVELWRGA